jgi:hypothetical protein
MEHSDALKCYPLYTTPYFRRSGTIFSPSNSPIRGASPRILGTCSCFCTCTNEPSNLSSTGEQDNIMCAARKRRQDDNKENEAVSPDSLLLPPTKKPRAYAQRRSNEEKLQTIFQVINDAHWSMSEFLYYTFRNKDSKGKAINRDHSHASTVQKFLTGQTRYNPAHIINFWFCHPDGRLEPIR